MFFEIIVLFFGEDILQLIELPLFFPISLSVSLLINVWREKLTNFFLNLCIEVDSGVMLKILDGKDPL